MDHVDLPADPALPPLKIPMVVLPGHEYDGLDFPHFLERKGFVLTESLGLIDINRHTQYGSQDVTSSILQSWLFFGLIHEVATLTPVTYDPEHYISRPCDASDSRAYITTAMLQALLQALRKTLHGDQEFSMVEAHSANDELTLITSRWHLTETLLDRWDTFMNRNHDPSQLQTSRLVRFSIHVLLQKLGKIISMPGTVIATNAFVPRLLRERLTSTGWCRNHIAGINEQQLDYNSWYFLSMLKPQQPDRHRQCCADECLDTAVDENSYERPHTSTCIRGECKGLTAGNIGTGDQWQSVSAALREGMLPTVTYNRSTKILQCHGHSLTDLKRRQAYVAISHVWSDGLGNRTKNAIHACQAERLQWTVNELLPCEDVSEAEPFWIDTLCVPIEPEDRAIAIGMIKESYAHAAATLVLDSILYEAPRNASLWECVVRLVASRWMTRLWTLQEALFSRKLYFLFGQQHIALAQLQDLDKQTQTWCQSATGKLSLLTQFALPFQHPLIQDTGRSARVLPKDACFCLATMHVRSTSRLGDEALCISSMIGHDPRELLSIAPQERMRSLFQSLERVPMGLIFKGGPRYHESGSRWIPKSMLWNGTGPAALTAFSRTVLDGSTAIPTEWGLICKGPVLRFRADIAELGLHEKGELNLSRSAIKLRYNHVDLIACVCLPDWEENNLGQEVVVIYPPKASNLLDAQGAVAMTIIEETIIEETLVLYTKWIGQFFWSAGSSFGCVVPEHYTSYEESESQAVCIG